MDIFTPQIQEDFIRAKNKAFFNEIQHFLTPEEASLISLNDVNSYADYIIKIISITLIIIFQLINQIISQ